MELKKCVVAHPQMQHSMKLAYALKREGLLQSYQTMLFYGKDALLNMILDSISRNSSVQRFVNRCKESKLDAKDVILHSVLKGLALEFLARMDKAGKLYYDFYVYVTGQFAEKVAQNAIANGAEMVIMYDYTAKKCFEYLTKHNSTIIKVLDMSSLPPITIDEIITREEAAGYKNFFTLKRGRYSKKRCTYYKNEIMLADYFLSPSRSVTDALVSLGVNDGRIIQVPFGVDLQSFSCCEREYHQDHKLHFLFVGRMEGAKGICYLMDAFDRLSMERNDFVLDLVGAACGNDLLIDKTYVVYHGVVNKQKMIQLYRKADVFVFPTLWEGCSLSLMEAMASGLPVIATEKSGIKEFLCDSDIGFCIEESNSNDIYYYANWYLDHTALIPEMGKQAAIKMLKYSWDNYYNTISKSISSLLSGSGREL